MATAAVGAIGIGASLFSGKKNRSASKSAQQAQTVSSRAALDAQARNEALAIASQERAQERAISFQEDANATARGDLAPFREFGQGQIDPLQDILTQEGQSNFLANNPLFDAALSNVNQDTNAGAASRGRFSAGDTAAELFDNYLATAFPLLQSQTNNLFRAVGIGGNAAAGQANVTRGTSAVSSGIPTGVGNLLQDQTGLITGAGNAAAAGQINRGNIFGDTVGGIAGSIPPLLEGFQNFRNRRAAGRDINTLFNDENFF